MESKRKKDTNELISKIVRNSADIEDKIMLTKRERGLREGITLEAVIFIFILNPLEKEVATSSSVLT